MPQEIKEKIIEILELLKWGKMSLEGEGTIATTCHNAFKGINPCCFGCPPCNCHRELEEFADQLLELSSQEKQKWVEKIEKIENNPPANLNEDESVGWDMATINFKANLEALTQTIKKSA